VDGVPSLGWEATASFLILPIFLVLSQYVSMQLMQPQTQDPQAQQANAVLKVLPLMIGWFSLNVPAALCIYWVANNIITTVTTLAIRNSMAPAVAGSVSNAVDVPTSSSSVFAPPPMREKPQGFAASSFDGGDGIKPITPIDAEILDTNVAETFDTSGSGMDTKVR
jgi:YidC/Oxa1 family membrane protein insertase